MAKTRAHLFVSGRVQGVFFRDGIRQLANRHGVGGWVRNTFDGRVEVVIEGEENDVETLIRWCHHGPPAAEVESVDLQRQDYVGDFQGFQVRR